VCADAFCIAFASSLVASFIAEKEKRKDKKSDLAKPGAQVPHWVAQC
jgi:hypothetical protein